ncbi:MAG TPA: SDR family oxidoreductase, partial [Lacipirellulaceae bacterium]|nr:SDR family oxidoreductase [Lacipirellulaceae bacterium]
MNLTGKRALITGGTKGIGAAIAIDLARQGCDVAINGRYDDESAAAVRRAIEASGRKCVSIIADMVRPDEVDRLVREAELGLGGLDILVHSAGGPAFGNIDDCSPEQWKATFDVHVHAAYFLCRRALPTLRKAGEAAIIVISSVAGIRGVPTHIAYGTVKGAILQFTRCLARDEADHNIRVNCVV